MRNTPKIGTPVKSEFKRNCLVCNRYSACADDRKSARFACSKFKENQHFDINAIFDTIESEKRAPTEDELILDEQMETDYVSKLDEILNSGLPVVPDLRYDDKHMPRAKNVFEWMTKRKFLGLTEIKPYAKQLQLICHIQGDWCPHCSNEDFFEDFPLNATYSDIRENITFLEHGKCPKCDVTKTDLLYGGSNVKVENYIDPFGTFTVAGQRSGKSIIVAMGESYTYHNFLMTPSVHRTFGIMSATPLVATYVALTFAQAKSTLWEPIAGFVAESPWFQQYHRWLDDLGRKNGEELYTFSETMLRYKHKNLITTVASPNKRTLRGKTSFSAAIDELGLFPIGKTKTGHDQERADGKEVITSLQNSMSTLRGAYITKLKQGYYRVPKPTLSAVSSPVALNDYIMYHYNMHLGGRTYYCFKSATWDFNPNMPREALDAEFRADPVKAERDYGANPPMTANAFLPKDKEVFELFDGKSNRISLMPTKIKTKKKKILTAGDIKRVHEWEHLIYGNPIMAIDAGLCLAGNSLIPTTKGLLRLDSVKEGMQVKGKTSKAKVETFHDNGEKQTYRVTSSLGNYVEATKDHKFMVLRDNKHEWIKLKDLSTSDLLCLNTNKVVRKSTLTHNGIKVTPNLAYLLGAIISEGSYSKYHLRISNTDAIWLKKLSKIIKAYVGKYPTIRKQRESGTEYTIKGSTGIATKDNYELILSSKKFCDFLNNLGLLSSKAYSRKTSNNQFIPDCIFQADEKSQMAFLASYIDGDGSIRKDQSAISIWSSSPKLLEGMQNILFSHGIITRRTKKDSLITTSSVDSSKLADGILPFIHKKITYKASRISIKNSIPSESFWKIVKARYVRSAGRNGSIYINDNGNEITLNTREFKKKVRKTFIVESYNKGSYNDILNLYKKISLKEYTKLKLLLEQKYRYCGISSITKSTIQKVYDLSIDTRKTPAYTANGITVHNCNNSFAFAIGGLTDEDPNSVFKVIAVGEIIPSREYPISFNKMFQKVLGPVVDAFGVCYLASDRWQNIKLMQDLEEQYDVAFEEYRLKKADFDAYKDDLKEALISFPKTEDSYEDIIKATAEDYPSCFKNKPSSHLFYQHITVQDTGNTVVKGAATDDIFRCCVMLNTMRKWNYVEEAMLDFTDTHAPKKNVIGIVAGLTKGITGNYSGGGSTTLGIRGSLQNRGGGGRR